MAKWVRIDTEEWAALYEDGKLVMYCDAYLVDEFLFYTVLGGETRSSDPWYDRWYDRNDGVIPFEMPERLEDYEALL